MEINAVLKIKLITNNAKIPTKAYSNDAGWDLYSIESKSLYPFEFNLPANSGLVNVRTGIEVAISEGYYGQVACRSSLGRRGIRVHPGVIDSGFRGEISIFMQNLSSSFVEICEGDKIAQLIILPIFTGGIEIVGELPGSERGRNGFGSSGR